MQLHTTGIVLAALTVVSAASAQSTQAVEWKVSEGGNGHWYGIRSRNVPDMTWMEMRTAAQVDGGHLVTLSGPAEDAFVFSFWSSLRLDDMMAGPLGYFITPGGVWQSVTGEPITYTNWRPAVPALHLNAAPDNGNSVHRFATWLDSSWGSLSGRWEDWLDSELGNASDPVSRFMVEWEADCNGDGIVDYGQIKNGELEDDNGDGVPDVCQTTVAGVIPVSGASTGGTAITIKGTNFPNSPTVLIGGVPAMDLVRVSATRITATTPAGLPGMTTVTVGSWVQPNAFYYRPECGSDLDQNGSVDAGDISIILLDFGPCYQTPLAAPAPEVPPLLDAQALPDAPRHR